MTTCPNCNYELVLLSSRPKYKCALCSKLYPKKEIDNKEFRQFNQRERELDKYNLDLEKQERKKLSTEKKITRVFKLLFRKKELIKRPRLNLTPEQRKLRKKEYNRKWNENNPDKLKAMRRRNLERHREKIYDYLKNWRINNLYESRLRQRLAFRRGKQRDLTLQLIENEPYKLSNEEIQELLPISALTHLLQL